MGERLKIEIRGDFTQCFRRDKNGDKVGVFRPELIESVTVHLYHEWYCQGADFSSLDGRPIIIDAASAYIWHPIRHISACEKSSKFSALSNSRVEYKWKKMTFKGISAVQTTDGRPCDYEQSESGWKTSGCLHLDREEIIFIGEKNDGSESSYVVKDLQRIEVPGGAELNKNGKFRFKSGDIKFSINNWTGSVNHQTSPPEWQAKSANNEIKSGKLDK